jgi:hypothetical protein
MSTWIAQGTEVVRTWLELSAHGRECPMCEEAITVWRRDAKAAFEPGWTVCCAVGRRMAEEWLAAQSALIARWQTDRRRVLVQDRDSRQIVPLPLETRS